MRAFRMRTSRVPRRNSSLESICSPCVSREGSHLSPLEYKGDITQAITPPQMNKIDSKGMGSSCRYFCQRANGRAGITTSLISSCRDLAEPHLVGPNCRVNLNMHQDL